MRLIFRNFAEIGLPRRVCAHSPAVNLEKLAILVFASPEPAWDHTDGQYAG
jgi:hypothetical protein